MIHSISFQRGTFIDVVGGIGYIGGRWMIFRIDRFIVCRLNFIEWSRSWTSETISLSLSWRYMTRLNHIFNQNVIIEPIYWIAVRSMSAKTTRLPSHICWYCWRMIWNVFRQYFVLKNPTFWLLVLESTCFRFIIIARSFFFKWREINSLHEFNYTCGRRMRRAEKNN